MLIAEELVLLALDADGTLAQSATGSHSYVEVGVTGALLAELGISGHLDLADGRIAAAEGSAPDHPLLAAALAAAATQADQAPLRSVTLSSPTW